MKLPSGWIIFLRSNPKGTEVEMESKELVLCKDCKHINQKSQKDAWMLCSYNDWVLSDGYCSWGERKDNETD